MAEQRPAPSGIDVRTPNVARIWDYQLGGKDNFAADRAAADAINQAMAEVNVPDGRAVAGENRAFLRRAVRYLAGHAGVRQFLDLGAGLPTQGNVHEIAHEAAPDARVVYVDYDPVVVAHGRALLTGTDKTTVIQADLRRPHDVLRQSELTRLLDLSQPAAVLLVATLHLVTDDEDPAGIVAVLREAMAPGSYLVITHATRQRHEGAADMLAEVFSRLRVTTPMVPRGQEEIMRLFDGFTMVEPGLVFPALWRPDGPILDTGAHWMFAGVAQKSPAS